MAFAVVLVAGFATLNFCVITNSHTKGLFYQSSANPEVLANGETTGGSDEYIFEKEKDDCSVTIESEAGTIVTFLGSTYTIPPSGKLTLHFGKVDIECDMGGNEQCTTVTCYDFWNALNESIIIE